MVCIPTICPIHAVPMEDHCSACLSQEFPIFAKTSRGFRLLCAGCKRPLASPRFPGNAGRIPEVETLQAFEWALSCALKKEGSLQFPGASVGHQWFLQMVEDLLWLLLTSPREGFEHLVNWLNDTVVRVPRRLYRNPGARPWLGDFPIQIRRGLVSHLAALVGGTAARKRLFAYPTSRYTLQEVVKMLRPSDAKEFQRRSTAWPQLLQTLVFEPQSTH